MLPTELVAESFTLAEADGDVWTLRIPAGATAQIEMNDASGARAIDPMTLPTDAMGTRSVRMIENMRVRIELGAFSFFARVTESTPKAETSPMVKWSDHRWLLVSVLGHVVFLAALFFAPPRAGALVLDMDGRTAERIRVTIDAVEQERLEQLSHDAPGESGAQGSPMTGESGVAGAETETRHTGGGIQVRGPATRREVPLTVAQVMNLNSLGALASFTASLSSISSPFGAANALGAADVDAYGDINSAIPGFSPGSSGFGMIGIGRGACPPGANCTAGAIGVGELGTGGMGRGCDEAQFAQFVRELGRAAAVDRCSGVGGPGVGIGTPGRMHHGSRVPNPIGGVPTTSGGLSREDIRRVVQRHLPEVRHCYEQALMVRPDLEGRVSERFVIQPDGRVQGVVLADSSMHNGEVESCVTQAVARWSFPQTESPTIVTYPFTFVPGN